MDFEKQDVQEHTEYGSLGAVCKTDTIVKDDNSFFRSVSQVICGSQRSHVKIRRAVVKYMANQSASHILLDKKYVSVAEYVTKSRIRYVGNRATEIEFQATANVFGVDIFLYKDGKWLKYSCIGTTLTHEGTRKSALQSTGLHQVWKVLVL